MVKNNSDLVNTNEFSGGTAGQGGIDDIAQVGKFYSAGQFKQAQRLCKDILQYEPENTIVLRQLGVISHRLGELSDAFDCFSYLTKLAPEDDTVFYNLGHTGVLIGNFDLAFAAFSKTIELNPGSARAYNNLGVILERRGDYEAAVDYFYDASDVDANHVLSRIHLVDCLLALQRFDECKQVIDDALKISSLSADQRGDLLVDRAVIAWLRADIEVCSRVLGLCKHVVPHMRAPEIYVQPYLDLLIGLLELHMCHPEMYKFEFDETVYYVGDQQCLTINNTLFEIDNQRCCVNAHLVADGRLMELTSEGANNSKVSFATAIELVPDNARLLIGFGELDCRVEQGLHASLKAQQQDIDICLENLAGQYLDYVRELCLPRSIEPVIVGIPAFNGDMQALAVGEQQEILYMIEQLNAYISDAALARGYRFLDVYTATVADSGRSNQRFYFNSHYLLPEAFQLAARQYLLDHRRHR